MNSYGVLDKHTTAKWLYKNDKSLIAYTFRENRNFVFIIIVQFMMSTNSWIRFGLQIVLVCLRITPSHCHHCANLSEDIELMPVRYILSSVWIRLSIFSQLSIIQYMRLCVQLTHHPCDDWDNIYFVLLPSSNRKYGLWPTVYDYVMKQWYAQYVSLYSYEANLKKRP